MNISTAISLTAAVPIVWIGGSRAAKGAPGIGRATTAVVQARFSDMIAAHWRGGPENRRWGGHWGGHGQSGNGSAGGCPSDRSRIAAGIELMLSAARGHLRIAAKQEGEWRELATAVRAEAGRLGPLCGQWRAANDRPMTDRLVLAKTALRQSADALARLRPALDGLYRELDPAQRRLFDRLMRRNSRRRWAR